MVGSQLSTRDAGTVPRDLLVRLRRGRLPPGYAHDHLRFPYDTDEQPDFAAANLSYGAPEMPPGSESVEQLWTVPEPQLLSVLGEALLGAGIGFAPEDQSRARRFAERWLAERWKRIRETLCGDPRLRAVLYSEMGNRLLKVATVADALAMLAGRPATSVLAVIVLRRGGSALCDAVD